MKKAVLLLGLLLSLSLMASCASIKKVTSKTSEAIKSATSAVTPTFKMPSFKLPTFSKKKKEAVAEVEVDLGAGRYLEISTKYGTSLDAYISGPVDTNYAVLIIHDRWGFDEDSRLWADRYAELGYRAMVIDLFDGRYALDYQQATTIMKSMDYTAVQANISGAIEYLILPGRKLTLVGFGYGGGQVLQSAISHRDEIVSTVMFYGPLEHDVDKLRQISGPVLGIYSSQDEWVGIAEVEQFVHEMHEAGKTIRALRLDDVGPGFINSLSPYYDKERMEDMWILSSQFIISSLEGDEEF